MTGEEKLLGFFILMVVVAIIVVTIFGPPRKVFERSAISAEAAPELPELVVKPLTKPYLFRDNAYERFYLRKILIGSEAYVLISSDGNMRVIKCE